MPAASFASRDATASHRFAEKRRWIAWSSRSDVPCRYASIRWPVPVVRSGRHLVGRFFVSLRCYVVPPPTATIFFCLLRCFFLLLTWGFASLDGYAVRGETLSEKLRLGGLA